MPPAIYWLISGSRDWGVSYPSRLFLVKYILPVAQTFFMGRSAQASQALRTSTRLLVHPHEMGPTMQAEGVEVHDAADTAEWESLMVAMPDKVFAAVHQEPSPAPDGSPGRGLQGRKSDDRWHA